MSTVVTCPHCKKPIDLSDALSGELKEELKRSVASEYEKEAVRLKEEAEKKWQEELAGLKDRMAVTQKALEDAQKQELALRKDRLELEEKQRSFELEKQRELDKERDAIRTKTLEEAAERTRMKEKEKDMVIDQLKKALDDAQRKASQGSQQLQGEVQELDLENLLRTTFPQDSIEPIGKGVLGADIRQVVKSPLGTVCGTILWESKRTKQWADGWTGKLKQDVLADKANIPALVSEVLPEDAKSGIGLVDGVWVCSPKLTVPLAVLLRKSLLDVAKQRKITENRQSKAEELYGYVTSHEFQHQVEAMMEVYEDMKDQIQRERNALERSWKLREQQVTRLMSGVAGMYGSMQGIAGQALPSIKQLDFSGGNESSEDADRII